LSCSAIASPELTDQSSQLRTIIGNLSFSAGGVYQAACDDGRVSTVDKIRKANSTAPIGLFLFISDSNLSGIGARNRFKTSLSSQHDVATGTLVSVVSNRARQVSELCERKVSPRRELKSSLSSHRSVKAPSTFSVAKSTRTWRPGPFSLCLNRITAIGM